MKTNSGAVSLLLELAILLALISAATIFFLANHKSDVPKLAPTLKKTAQKTTAPATSSATPLATSSALLTPAAHSTSALTALHIDSIDYSQGHPAGLVAGAKVRLYKMDGTFIGEKTPTPYVQNGQVGTGGDTIFYVLPSTYKVESSFNGTSGTCTVTVRSTTEFNDCSIYLVTTPVHMSGVVFADGNHNGNLDSGERTFGNKNISFYFKNSDGTLYSAGKTKTDGSGNYSIDLPYVGSFSAVPDPEDGLGMPPQKWVDLSGGQSTVYNLGFQ